MEKQISPKRVKMGTIRFTLTDLFDSFLFASGPQINVRVLIKA